MSDNRSLVSLFHFLSFSLSFSLFRSLSQCMGLHFTLCSTEKSCSGTRFNRLTFVSISMRSRDTGLVVYVMGPLCSFHISLYIQTVFASSPRRPQSQGGNHHWPPSGVTATSSHHLPIHLTKRRPLPQHHSKPPPGTMSPQSTGTHILKTMIIITIMAITVIIIIIMRSASIRGKATNVVRTIHTTSTTRTAAAAASLRVRSARVRAPRGLPSATRRRRSQPTREG